MLLAIQKVEQGVVVSDINPLLCRQNTFMKKVSGKIVLVLYSSAAKIVDEMLRLITLHGFNQQ